MSQKPTQKSIAAAASALCGRYAPSLAPLCTEAHCKVYTKRVIDAVSFATYGACDTAAYAVCLHALAGALVAAGAEAPQRVSAGGFAAVARDPLALADALRREADRVTDAVRLGDAPAVRSVRG